MIVRNCELINSSEALSLSSLPSYFFFFTSWPYSDARLDSFHLSAK
jgi:hypothetical protein